MACCQKRVELGPTYKGFIFQRLEKLKRGLDHVTVGALFILFYFFVAACEAGPCCECHLDGLRMGGGWR